MLIFWLLCFYLFYLYTWLYFVSFICLFRVYLLHFKNNFSSFHTGVYCLVDNLLQKLMIGQITVDDWPVARTITVCWTARRTWPMVVSASSCSATESYTKWRVSTASAGKLRSLWSRINTDRDRDEDVAVASGEVRRRLDVSSRPTINWRRRSAHPITVRLVALATSSTIFSYAKVFFLPILHLIR